MEGKTDQSRKQRRDSTKKQTDSLRFFEEAAGFNRQNKTLCWESSTFSRKHIPRILCTNVKINRKILDFFMKKKYAHIKHKDELIIHWNISPVVLGCCEALHRKETRSVKCQKIELKKYH